MGKSRSQPSPNTCMAEGAAASATFASFSLCVTLVFISGGKNAESVARPVPFCVNQARFTTPSANCLAICELVCNRLRVARAGAVPPTVSSAGARRFRDNRIPGESVAAR